VAAVLRAQIDIDGLLGALDIRLEVVEPAFQAPLLGSHALFRPADRSELAVRCDVQPSAFLSVVHVTSIGPGS
jgi:hypothetical protein